MKEMSPLIFYRGFVDFADCLLAPAQSRFRNLSDEKLNSIPNPQTANSRVVAAAISPKVSDFCARFAGNRAHE